MGDLLEMKTQYSVILIIDSDIKIIKIKKYK